MPITLPDPVLALSMASLQKLNTADVDQLANLWNVFTKCKESIESGRRLENLSWRLWFREAHLLPPDTSLSDLTDFTPLDTPLMSRRGSMAGSYQPSTRSMTPFVPHQPSSSFTSRALQAASMAMAASTHGNTNHTSTALSGDLSDPEESEGWSSDDDDESDAIQQSQEVASSSNLRGRVQGRPSQVASTSNPATRSFTSPKSVTSPLARETILNQQQQNEKEIKSNNASSNVSTTHSGDRRRAISSSSAFGSRARVKQHNMQRRRRPLSFQQAIESLLLDRESEFSGRMGSGSTSSLPRSIDESRLPSTSSRLMGEREDLECSDATIAEQIPQNSAPAEFSQPSTPQKLDQLSVTKKPARRVSIVDAREEENESAKPKEQNKESNQSRFFVGAASYEGSEHSLESESSHLKTTSSKPKDNEEAALRSPVQRFKNLHPTSSSGSVEGLRKTSGSRAHHPSHHTRNTSSTIRTKSALNLHRKNGQGKPRGHVRIASISKDLAEVGKATSSVENANEQPKLKRPPVKFTMGSMEGDSDDDYSSVSSEKEGSEVIGGSGKETKVQIEAPGENSDEWASDSSTDSEEERKRSAERRKRAEKERLENMFKKVPVRSQSAADISLLTPGSNSVEHAEPKSEASYSTSPAPPPIRSLLSTIFHPTNDDDLARRKSYASAADLRIQGEQNSNKKKVRKTSHEGSEIAQQAGHFAKNGKSTAHTNVIPRPPSFGSHLNNAGLKMSKSAVALPVLSTLGSRSSTSISRREAQGTSRHAAVFEDDSSGESSISDRANNNTTDASSRQSNSEAVERLNELARVRQNQNKQKKKQHQRGSGSGDIEERKMSEDGGSRKRTSHSSLDVQVQPEFDEEKMIRQYRRTSEPTEAPSTPAIATSAGGKPQRSKSAVNVPEVGLPQSPRTTRRNMLKDELSESLRQNLLWERQSRNRMLGIGGNRVTTAPLANESTAEQQEQMHRQRSNEGKLTGFAPLIQTTSAPMQPTPSSAPLSQSHSQQGHSTFHRTQSVLGGNALRPLTQRSTMPDPNANRKQGSSSSRVPYTGDFHHTGW